MIYNQVFYNCVRQSLTLALTVLSGVMLAACSSEPPKPPAPEWLHRQTRTIDNGYIIYIGHSEASSQQRAQLQAEGVALEDLANECSVIPKGARVEDRYDEKTKSGHVVYVKLGVEFQECDQASKAIDPQQIKVVANIAFTEQLKRYQDLNETGDMPDSTEVAQVSPPSDVRPAPAQGAWSSDTHFYVVRQYVAYQKEVVVLSPPGSYQPSSPESTHFITQVQPAATQVASMQTQNPALKTNPQPWSSIPDRPHLERPAGLAPRAVTPHRVSAPHAQSARPPNKANNSNGGRKRRRHYHD